MSKITRTGFPFIAAGLLLGQQALAAPPANHAGHSAAPPEAIVTELMAKDLPDIPSSIVMQVKGGKEVTPTPGQTWYEGPNDIHTVGRNASQTHPAKFVVMLVKKKGAPILIPVK